MNLHLYVKVINYGIHQQKSRAKNKLKKFWPLEHQEDKQGRSYHLLAKEFLSNALIQDTT